MTRSAQRAWLCILCVVSCGGLPRALADSTPPLSTAELLVDLARDQALSRRGERTAADIKQVRTLLRAAVRLDPQLASAWELLYELASLEGDHDEAARALTAILLADPLHERAFSLWLEAGAAAQQTAERRTAWLSAVQKTSRPPWQQSMICTAQARNALAQLDVAEAKSLLDRALELEPANLDAAELMLDVLNDETPPEQWLATQLRILQLSPLSGQAAWQAASTLDEHGLCEEAGRFFDYALKMHATVHPEMAVPGRFWLSYARNLLARGRLDEAIDFTRRAATADPRIAAEAGFALHYLHTLKQDGVADQIRSELAARFAAIRDPNDFPANEVAQAAWFYLTLDAQPDRALMLARSAVDRAPTDTFAQRVLGWALAANGQSDEARRVLTPIATRDAYAAQRLATDAQAAGRLDEARAVLAALAPRPIVGPAADAIAALETSLNGGPAPTSAPATAPTPDTAPTSAPTTRPATTRPATTVGSPHAAALRAALARFDDRVLEFFAAPGRFVEPRVEMVNRAPVPGEPWLAEFSLTNVGPFVLTLGPDGMFNPVFVVSVAMDGDRKRDFPGLLTVGLERNRILRPGETVSVRRTIDVGPARRASRDTPQQAQRITLNAVLDGVLSAGGTWLPGPTGQSLRAPVYFNRLPAATDRASLAGLFGALQSDAPARFRAADVLAQLLGERQRAELKRTTYTPGPIPADRVEDAIAAALASDDGELRFRALDALTNAGLNRRLLAAAEECLDHPEWLVRLGAIRLVARQGPVMKERFEKLASGDADELVRDFAAAIIASWDEPTSR